MSELKYKVGDKVLIKDIGWYNDNKTMLGNVECGDALMTFEKARFCGKIVTISSISDVTDTYGIEEDNGLWKWTDEMFERLVERNGKTYPYKIGDRVVLKGNNRCATITDLKYNSWGNLSYYIKIDNDKDISIDYPTDLLLPYDNMVEGLVEEETKPKFKVGDKVRIKSEEWYKQMLSIPNKIVWQNKLTNDFVGIWCGSHVFKESMFGFLGKTMTIQEVGIDFYLMEEDTCGYEFNDEMIEGLVEEECPQDFIEKYCISCGTQRCDRTKEFLDGCPHYNAYMCKKQNNAMEEETPKFKVNDIVFVKNLGWVRITNGYWDSFVNEYIYEVIGFKGEGEYDSINQSDIECQMLPESENPHTGGNKITLDEYKNNDKEWLFNKLAMLDNITALESIQDIFNHLQQSKYPKSYEECCKVLGVNPDNFISIRNLYRDDGDEESTDYERDLLEKFDSLWVLLICRDAYWKVYGEKNGLGKPWKPDWNDEKQDKYGFYNEVKYTIINPAIFVFPTEEMRDAFKDNFKKEIEMCKELL